MKDFFEIFKKYTVPIGNDIITNYYQDEYVISYNIGCDYWVHIWLLPLLDTISFSIGKYVDYTDEDNYEMENRHLQFICKKTEINCMIIDKEILNIRTIYINDFISESINFINSMICELLE